MLLHAVFQVGVHGILVILSRLKARFLFVQSRHDAHHGNFGRGKGTWILDCRHFCTSVVDVWNIVLYNQLC